nr:hypothetical protein [uncultured Agrobacterium sp.]
MKYPLDTHALLWWLSNHEQHKAGRLSGTSHQQRAYGSQRHATGDHRDPFDRILAAQAILENMVLISIDEKIPSPGVMARR